MDDATLPATHGDAALMTALRAVAPTENKARDAFDTWSTVQLLGWPKARGLYHHVTWYRRLALLRRAGIGTPVRPYGKKGLQTANSREALTFSDCQRLVGAPFAITDPWDRECYPAGTTGTVSAVLFRDGAWSFELAYDGSPGGHEFVPVRTLFERCSVSEGGPDAG